MNYVKGDLLSVERGIIVHGCNAQGVMGSGVAKVIKAKFPDAYKNYVNDLNLGIGLGDVSWSYFYVGAEEQRNLAIASAITQEFYGKDGGLYVDYCAVSECMDEIFFEAKKLNMTVAMPLIGCGLGGGDWHVVERLIREAAIKNNYSHDYITVYGL